ncbi:MAG TPA: hypothetical protein VK658_16080 [Chryseolinea sp.]|nr:hypothetical protein [Chryseolinea sp.]
MTTKNVVAIREITYDTNDDSEKVFSRLSWAVERVDGLAGQLITNVTVDTNRPWVGVYDTANLEFGLIEPRGYFSLNVFQIVVRGKVTQVAGKTIVSIKLKLGWHTFLTALAICVLTVVMFVATIMSGETKAIVALIAWILTFPVVGTILMNRKLNKIESKLEELFGFNELS